MVKGHWQLLALVAVIFALWSTPVMVPLKILVVVLHELSHGLAALLTGGSIVEITVSPGQGGLALTRGGSRFLILSAGYFGSLLLGMGLLFAALRSTADRAIVAGLAGVLILVSLLYLRDMFALFFCLGLAAILLAMARWLDHRANDLVLRVIGLTSMIYVPYDIFSDTILRAHLRSDARLLAEEVGGATLMWGALWLGLSLAAIAVSLRYGLGAKSNLDFSTHGAG